MIQSLLLGLALARAASADGAPADAAPAFATPDAIDGWLNGVVLLQIGPAWCSGVVIDDQGTVATAYHCVSSGLRVKITTRGGKTGIARTVSAWPSEDLALIRAPELAASLTRALPIRATLPRVGARVYGLGHPYAPLASRSPQMEGMLLWSVTEGIVSNTGPHLIQTDAALNPGNSGGPVVDGDGGIVGITSRKIGGDNIAFAATSTKLAELVAHPRPPRLLEGQTFLGSSLYGGLGGDAALTWEARGGAVIRDRAVAELGIGIPIDARNLAEEEGSSWYPGYALGLSARQRFGRGALSTTLDLGGTVLLAQGFVATTDASGAVASTMATPLAVRGGVVGRVGLGGIALRAVAVSEGGAVDWLFGLDVDVPGEVGTF